MRKMYAFLSFIALFVTQFAVAQPTLKILSPTSTYMVNAPSMDAVQLSAYAFTGNENTAVEDIIFEIGGEELTGSLKDSTFFAYWTPTSMGTHTLNVSASDADGNTQTETMDFEVGASTEDLMVRTMDKSLISVSTVRTYRNTYQLPTSVNAYKQLIGHLDITCPDGGCDPYDRLARIQARQAGGKWVEIIRYITSFGVGCSHTVDLTDYLSFLQGEVEIQMFIDTWSHGWEATLDLEYKAGTPDYKYQTIDVLWDGAYNYGDVANLDSTEPYGFQFGDTAEKANLRLYTTGHGWGANNTLNAAEFLLSTNKLIINGDNYNVPLEMDCNPNPDQCQPQAGTWEFNRAGWCPGAAGKLFEFDLSDYVNSNWVNMDYNFDNYIDFCHPNHPNCINNVTCSDCDAGFNPHYWIAANIITHSNTPPDANFVVGTENVQRADLGLNIRPNPSNGQFILSTRANIKKATIRVLSLTGQLVYQTILKNTYNGFEKAIDLTTFPKGIYSLFLETEQGFDVKKVVVQ